VAEIRCECGEVLVEEVTTQGVRPVGWDKVIPFRRNTDFVMCANCGRDYNVPAMIARVEDANVISLLEQLAEEAEAEGSA
jgi:hypothetical protein